MKNVKAQISLYVHIYPHLKKEARKHGYALAIHGSCSRDFDLIAVPWVEKVSSPEVLMNALYKVSHAIAKAEKPQIKPHGRLAWSIILGGHLYIDLSVVPHGGQAK